MQLPQRSFLLAGGVGGLLEVQEIQWNATNNVNVRTLGPSVRVQLQDPDAASGWADLPCHCQAQCARSRGPQRPTS
eukprot:3623345-Prorocentrum_lima.AAC.1